MIKYFLFSILLILVFGCKSPNSDAAIDVMDFESCIGDSVNIILNELVDSFEDFLIENSYSKSKRDINNGIIKYLSDISNGTLAFDSLKFDEQNSAQLIKKIKKAGFINEEPPRFEYDFLLSTNRIEATDRAETNALLFRTEPYRKFLPCLEQNIKDTSSILYYYVDQKRKLGSLAGNIFAWNVLHMAKVEDYDSKIFKEIVIFESYYDLLLNKFL
jgi:hypothetical protein